MMKFLLSTLGLLLLSGSLMAQPKKDTSKIVCTVQLPKTITSETLFTIKADCKMTAFKIEVYSTGGQVMFKSEALDEKEIGNKFKALKEGVYHYKLTYSYYRGGVLRENRSEGQTYVIK